MRHLLSVLALVILAAGLIGLPACGGEGDGAGSGSLIADFDLEGEEYLAVPDTPLERLCSLFAARSAHALPNLGFNSNCYPFNQFTGEKNVQAGLEVIVSAPDMTFVAQGVLNTNGRVTFSDLPPGFLTLSITGADGNTYMIPVQVSDGMTSRAWVLVYRDAATGAVRIASKAIHDEDGDGLNDDDFSYALFGRARNQSAGGLVHLHVGNETRVDSNGDGDHTVVEPDDDGVASDSGDGDEDNDGIADNVDDDIDGDGIPNADDPDIDGDGLLNADDPHPNGDSPDDDYNPPGMEGSLLYSGVKEVAQIDAGTVAVYFPVGLDDKNEPVSYNIYYSTTTPIDFDSAAVQRFRPLAPVSPDEILSDNIVGLVVGQVYFFAVRAQDAAQPPNEDTNENELSLEIQ
jgi:hypothetical protein